MRRYILPIAIITFLGILAWLIWSSRGSTLSGSDKEFSFDPEIIISRIEIRSPGSEVLLEKHDKWMTNQAEADEKKVRTLIQLSSQVRAVSPVSREVQSIVKDKLTKGKQITFYSGRKKIRSYTVYKHSNKLYALKDGKNKPYRIEIRGFSNTDLFRLLEDNSENWKSLYILNSKPAEILDIRLTYFRDITKGFHLSVSDNGDIRLYDHAGLDITPEADTGLLNEYLYFFSYIPFEFLPDSLLSVDTLTRFFLLELRYRDGTEDLITAFKKYAPGSDQADPVFFIGIPYNKRGVELRYSDFDPILLPVDYFLKK